MSFLSLNFLIKAQFSDKNNNEMLNSRGKPALHHINISLNKYTVSLANSDGEVKGKHCNDERN